jgi:hypothetical protein
MPREEEGLRVVNSFVREEKARLIPGGYDGTGRISTG